MKKIAIIIITILQIAAVGLMLGVFVLIFMGKLYALVGCMAALMLMGVCMLEEIKDGYRAEK